MFCSPAGATGSSDNAGVIMSSKNRIPKVALHLNVCNVDQASSDLNFNPTTELKDGDSQPISARSSLHLPASAKTSVTTGASRSERETPSSAARRPKSDAGWSGGVDSLASCGPLTVGEKKKPRSGDGTKKVRFSGWDLAKVPALKGDSSSRSLRLTTGTEAGKTPPEPSASRDPVKDLIFGTQARSQTVSESSAGQARRAGDSEIAKTLFGGGHLTSSYIMAVGGDKAKRSFEFRMCKKVAELTQVVHMLFTRNHEKEVELESLKAAYEHEISEVVSDARSKIAVLEKQQEETMKERAGEIDRIRMLLEGTHQAREEEWKRRLEEGERLLQEERAECQNLRDMLIHAQRDIETLRQSVADQLTSRAGELARREQEVDRLRKQVATLEQAAKDVSKGSGERLRDLERCNERLERELGQVHGALEDSQRARDSVAARCRQLEMDIKTLKRDFNRRVAEVINSQARLPKSASSLTQEQSEELEKLRREVQRYRLELSNRDVNFNRMFAEKQPTYVNRSGGGVVRLYASQPTGNIQSTAKREKTAPQGPVIFFEEPPEQHGERQRPLSTPAARAHAEQDSRLPSICSTPEAQQRPETKLAKPKPLPKEMLFGK